MQSKKRRPCLHSQSCICSNGALSEQVLLLVFKATNWNPFLICSVARVCRWLTDFAKRELWKEFCLSRAPLMVSDLLSGGPHSAIGGGWDSLGRLLLYCAGSKSGTNDSGGRLCQLSTVPGHFVRKTRFSKTSGKSFLLPRCRSDTLYVSDPCEHIGLDNDGDDDVGIFRGVFKAFQTSKTRVSLIKRGGPFENGEDCPYCRAKVWNMLAADLIPRSCFKRLGAYDDEVEFFVCLNGHLNGRCSLLHLSDSEGVYDDE